SINRKHLSHQAGYNYPGYEMRQIRNRLDSSFEQLSPKLIHQNCKYNWNCKTNDKPHDTHSKRIPQCEVKPFISKQLFEVIEPYPLLLQDGFTWFEFLKSHKPAPHRH